MPISQQKILDALRKVNDPQLHRDIVTLNMVKSVAYCDGAARVLVQLPKLGSPSKDQLRLDIERAVRDLGKQVKQVRVEFSASVQGAGQGASAGQSPSHQQAQNQASAREHNPLPGIRHIIAVGSGKGGVGKSMVAVNLAIGLARTGLAVGLLDGDIYGPSLPTMLGLDQLKPQTKGQQIVPFEVQGIKAMSVGSLVEEDKPLIWRGPMAHGAFRQLATQTDWGKLDYLIIDLPPGTGDVPLTMSQLLPLTGAVVVCTPQKVAQDDARRAVGMFQQLEIEVLGLVENMSYFIGDDGKTYDIFGRGGAEMMAQQLGLPFLGTVPINMALRRNSDGGDAVANFTGDEGLARELERMVQLFLNQVSVHEMSGAFERPSISVSE